MAVMEPWVEGGFDVDAFSSRSPAEPSMHDELVRWVAYVRRETTHSIPTEFRGNRRAIRIRDAALARRIADIVEEHL